MNVRDDIKNYFQLDIACKTYRYKLTLGDVRDLRNDIMLQLSWKATGRFAEYDLKDIIWKSSVRRQPTLRRMSK